MSPSPHHRVIRSVPPVVPTRTSPAPALLGDRPQPGVAVRSLAPRWRVALRAGLLGYRATVHQAAGAAVQQDV
ncbi:hypothetical protein ABZ569_14365 [Streptomyces albus]|uniref:hypothetical protein n=1 Tax=Streptomyces albus TaxID=1888 RepID=UPI0033EFA26B